VKAASYVVTLRLQVLPVVTVNIKTPNIRRHVVRENIINIKKGPAAIYRNTGILVLLRRKETFETLLDHSSPTPQETIITNVVVNFCYFLKKRGKIFCWIIQCNAITITA
jgi:hypothetical protein